MHSPATMYIAICTATTVKTIFNNFYPNNNFDCVRIYNSTQRSNLGYKSVEIKFTKFTKAYKNGPFESF